MPTIYVFCNIKDCDGSGGWHCMIAVAEDGACLADHLCANHSWARHDMGIDENGWKRDIYAKKYPNGFTVKWVEGDELTTVLASLPKPTASAPKEPTPHGKA